MADMKEIKPCPFCGGEPSLIPHIKNKTYEVRCLSSECYEGCALDTPDQAIKEWNTRAPSEQLTQTQQALDSAVEALKYVNNRIFDLETGRVDLRNNEYLTDSRRIIKAALASISNKAIEG